MPCGSAQTVIRSHLKLHSPTTNICKRATSVGARLRMFGCLGQHQPAYRRKKTLPEIQQDEILTKAILYNFMVIGEATRNIPAEVQSRYASIPWRLMGDMLVFPCFTQAELSARRSR